MCAPRTPVVPAITTDVVVVHDAVLLQDLVKDDASVSRLVFESAETDEQVIHLLIDGGIVQKLRRALFGLRIAGAENAERRKQIERLEPDELRVPATH